MPNFNGKTLTRAQTDYLVKLIKEGNTRAQCNAKLHGRFKRTINVRNISAFARQHNLTFSEIQEAAWSEKEEKTIRGLWLIGAGPQRRKQDMAKRSPKAIETKLAKLRYEGKVGEKVKTNIKKDVEKGLTVTQIAKKYGIDVKYVKEYKTGAKKSQVEIENLKRWEEKDIDEVLDLIERAQKALKGIDAEQEEANIKITTDNKYVALAMISDLHLENRNTNIAQLRKDFKTIKTTKDFYVGFGGDLIDNFIVGPHKEGVIEAVVPPKAARLAAGKLFDTVKGKLLWTIIGCHDDWDANFADYNLPEHIARKLKTPYLGHGGDINLTLRNTKKRKTVEYNLHARHKYRGSSGLNNGTACCKNILRDIDSKFDIVAVSHNHFAEIKIEHYLGKERVFIRTGSYKVSDRFSKKLGFNPNEFNILIPVVILNTETKEMKVVSGVRNAADTLKALNRGSR